MHHCVEYAPKVSYSEGADDERWIGTRPRGNRTENNTHTHTDMRAHADRQTERERERERLANVQNCTHMCTDAQGHSC